MDRATSLLKALDLLTLLGATRQGYTVQGLADALNQPRSTVVRILNTLFEYGLVAKSGRTYQVTAAFANWARPDRHAVNRARYRRALEAISSATGELVLLGVLDGAGIVHIDFIESDQAVRVAPAPLTRHNVRHNAMGKLALARRPDLAARWLDDKDFAAELELIRKSGIAWNREESVSGMIALACDGYMEAATEPKIAVAWPVSRFTEAKGRAAVKAIRDSLRA